MSASAPVEIPPPQPWVTKEGTRPGSWKKRYFVAGPHALYYFSKEEEGAAYKALVEEGYSDPPAKCLGSVPLENCSFWYGNPTSRSYCSELVKESSPTGYFEIMTGHRRYRYLCKNQSERLSWRQLISDNRARDEPWLLRFGKYDKHRHMVQEGTLSQKDNKGKLKEKLVVATFYYLLIFKNFDNHTPEMSLSLDGAEYEADPSTLVLSVKSHGQSVDLECPDQFGMDRWSGFLRQMTKNLENIRRIKSDPSFEVSPDEEELFASTVVPDLMGASGSSHH